MRAGSAATRKLLELIDQTAALDTEWIGPERFGRARAMFRKHMDQGFSFTDCTTFVVLEEMKVRRAVTTDRHFQQRGFKAMLIE
jgi:predicted nucleic acid-binding protein